MTSSKLHFLLAGLLVASPVARADSVLSDRNTFATAITGDATTLENWDELPAGTVITVRNGVTYTPGNSGDQALVTDANFPLSSPNTLGAVNAGFFDVGETMTFTFAMPVNVFGINFTTLATGAAYELTTNTGSIAFSALDVYPGQSFGEFAGLITTADFTSITITPLSDPGCEGAACAYASDDLTYGSSTPAVPEPGSLLLLASGLAACAFFKRRLQR